jgi:hypothetical protein
MKMIVAKHMDTREWVQINPWGVMAAAVRPFDGEPHIHVELGNGECHVAKLEWQTSPWLRRFLAMKAGVED